MSRSAPGRAPSVRATVRARVRTRRVLGAAVLAASVFPSAAAREDGPASTIELPGHVLRSTIAHSADGPARLLLWTVPVADESRSANEGAATRAETAESGDEPAPVPGCGTEPPVALGRPVAWTAGEDRLSVPETFAADRPAGLGAVDLDGDGTQDGVLWFPDGWTAWPGAPDRAAAPFPDSWPGSPTRVGPPEDSRFIVQRPGAFAPLEVRDGALRPGEPYTLPATLLQGGQFWILRSADVRRLETAAGTVLAAGPEARGRQRLRMRWYDEDRNVRVTWSLLPEAESVLQHRIFVGDDGEPRLLVWTAPASAGPLKEQRMRLFRGEPDRTRLGTPPDAAWTTRANLWQWLMPIVEDVDGDGRVDIALVYWKGLMSARVVIDVYFGTDRGFRSAPETVGFDVKGGDRGWAVLEDLDGDGDRDLLVRGKKGLFLRRGDARPGSLGLARKPERWSLPDDEDDRAGSEVSVSGDGTVAGAAFGGRPWLVPRGDGGRSVVIALGGDRPRLLVFEP